MSEEREGWENIRIAPIDGGPSIEVPMRPKTPEMLNADERFVRGALEQVGKAMSRQMEPGDISHKLLDPNNLRGDARIADMLAGIEDNFPQIKLEDDQSLADLGVNFAARVETAKAETKNPKVLGKLEKFKDKYLGKIAKLITHTATITRRNFLKLITLGGTATILAACAPGVVGPAPTTTDSGPGRATATAAASEAPTETATATSIPTETPIPPTATPEGPKVEYLNVPLDEYQISQNLKEAKKLPHDQLAHFTGENNVQFASWVAEANKEGLFPEVQATAEPFDTVYPTTQAFIKRLGKYGLVPLYSIDGKYKDPAIRPWVVAAAWKLDDLGVSSYLVLIKFKNKNGTDGFIAELFQPSGSPDQKVNGSFDWELANNFGGDPKKTTVGGVVFVNTPTVNGCQRYVTQYIQESGNRICNWYEKEDPAITNPQELLSRWQQTGILTNIETVDGKEVPLVPVVSAGDAAPGELFIS